MAYADRALPWFTARQCELVKRLTVLKRSELDCLVRATGHPSLSSPNRATRDVWIEVILRNLPSLRLQRALVAMKIVPGAWFDLEENDETKSESLEATTDSQAADSAGVREGPRPEDGAVAGPM